jgi:hypothetical protein
MAASIIAGNREYMSSGRKDRASSVPAGIVLRCDERQGGDA